MDKIEIDNKLFNELGIDSQDLMGQFKKLKSPEKSLSARLSEEMLRFLREKYPSDIESTELYLRDLLNKKLDFCILLYIIARKEDYFDEEISKEIYEKFFKKKEDDAQKRLFDIITSKKDGDILRRIHYTTQVRRRGSLSCKMTKKLKNINLKGISEDIAEKIIRSLFKSKEKRKNFHVWHILEEDGDYAFFIFRKAKSRKSLPSAHKKSYDFFDYARPIIIYLRNGCKELEIYQGDIKQSVKYAREIIKKYSKIKSNFDYELSNTSTKITNFNNFLSRIKTGSDKDFELCQIKFKPKEEFNDAFLTVSKNRDALKEMIAKLEKTFSNEVNTGNVSEIIVIYKDKRYSLYIGPKMRKDRIVIFYTPKTNDLSLAKEFKDELKKHLINLNKCSR